MHLSYIVGTFTQVRGAKLYVDILIHILQDRIYFQKKVVCFSKSNCISLQSSSVNAVVNVTVCTVLIHLNVECPDIIITSYTG